MFALISPHSANRSKLPPQSVRIYSLAISTMSANVSVSLLPSAYWNVTLSSPIEHMAVTVCPDATALPFRASLLTLGNAQTRLALLSLNRSLQIADDVGGSSVTVHLPS